MIVLQGEADFHLHQKSLPSHSWKHTLVGKVVLLSLVIETEMDALIQ